MPWSFYNSSGKLIDGVLDGSVTAAKMAINSVDSDQYVDGSIDNAHLANMAAGTVKANATGSAANPTDVSLASATQATIAGDDVVLIYDTSATALATMTRTNFVAGVGGGPTEAVQSDMENEGSSNANRYASSEIMKYHPGVVKASVRIASNGTIVSDDYNVTSITPNSTGDRTITWEEDFDNENYAVVSTDSGSDAKFIRHTAFAVGSVRLTTVNAANSTLVDSATSTIAVGKLES